MTIADRPRVDLREVLRTTCAASPVEAIDVMADGLATLTGATYVEFLITNVTHRAAVLEQMFYQTPPTKTLVGGTHPARQRDGGGRRVRRWHLAFVEVVVCGGPTACLRT